MHTAVLSFCLLWLYHHGSVWLGYTYVYMLYIFFRVSSLVWASWFEMNTTVLVHWKFRSCHDSNFDLTGGTVDATSKDKVGIMITLSFLCCKQVHCVCCPVLVGIRTSQAVFAVLEYIWMWKPLIRQVMWPCKGCHLSGKCGNML